MTLTIELPDEDVTALAAKAQARNPTQQFLELRSESPLQRPAGEFLRVQRNRWDHGIVNISYFVNGFQYPISPR